MATGIRARLSRAEGRKFGLTLGVAFGALGGLMFWRDHDSAALVVWTLAGALLLAGLVVPDRLGPIQRAWMGLAHAINRVTTPILMAVIYFIVITPFGLLMRAFGRNPLAPSEAEGSFWVSRETEAGQSDLRRQF